MPEIQMPKLSDSMTEGTLVAWKKKKGDKVSAGEVIAEIETDKATMEWESPEDGMLTEIYVEEGGKVNVGGKIAFIGEATREQRASMFPPPRPSPLAIPSLAEAAKGDTKKAPSNSIFAGCFTNFFCGIGACLIYFILLEMIGYDIGRYGLPSWWWVPATFFFIVIRVAWTSRKTSSKAKGKK